MMEFWESVYRANEIMWGDTPCDNAKEVLALFEQHDVKSVLVPGFGYGRNAKLFFDHGIKLAGIEISETAIERAEAYFGNKVKLHHGNVSDMPFDDSLYDAIYCYSLIHLLTKSERLYVIKACFDQLNSGGIMVFVALSTKDKRFGVGEKIGKNTFLSPNGLLLYFYDQAAVKSEFRDYGIISLEEIKEPKNKPSEIHWMVVCRK